MSIQGSFSFLKPAHQRPNQQKRGLVIASSPDRAALKTDQFQRSKSRSLTGIQAKPLSDSAGKLTQNGRMPGRWLARTITQASLRDQEYNQSLPPIVNPIPYERVDSLLKALQAEAPLEAVSLLKEGHAAGLKNLLLISNRMVSDINGLRKQGRHNIRFVYYLDDPRLKSLKDPGVTGQDPELAEDPAVYYYFTKPEILGDAERIYQPLLHAGQVDHLPEPASPENVAKGVGHLDFTEEELQWLRRTAKSAGFQNNEAHFTEYLARLFEQAEKLHAAWAAIPRQDIGVFPLKLGIYSDNLPYMQYLKRGKRKEPPIRDFKGWQRLDDHKRHWAIHEVTRLFPQCDLLGYTQGEAQQKLNLESRFPFWYEKD